MEWIRSSLAGPYLGIQITLLYYLEWACQIFDPYLTFEAMVESSESMLVG